MNSDDLWYEEPDSELDEFDDDDVNETVPCNECGADVYEDAVQCPHCGAYILSQTNVWAGRPGWWIALGLLGILAVILTLAGYFAQ